MKKLIALAAGSLLLTAALIAAPAVARPPPAGVWIVLHFTGAHGRTKTVTQQLQIVRADYAPQACGPDLQKGAAFMARIAEQKHPELASLTFTGASCATDRSGKIRVAVGAWPTGGK